MEVLIFKFVGMIVGWMCFVFGYRQTLGAHKERVRAANSEVEKILLRRVVLEKYTPGITDVSRLLEGKARDFKVRVEELLSEDRVLNSLFTRVQEAELIAPEAREAILNRMLPVLQQIDGKPAAEATRASLPGYHRNRRLYRAMVLSVIIGVSSLLGGMVTALPRLGAFEIDYKNIIGSVLITAGLSLILISLYYTYRRMQEFQQDLNPGGAAQSMTRMIDFCNEITRIIDKRGLKYRPAGVQEKGYDFELALKNETFLVLVKAWDRSVPMAVMAQATAALSEAVSAQGVQGGILVTPAAIKAKNAVLKGNNLSLLTVHEFKQLLNR